MALENILSQEMIQRLGWTLLHFVWQATAVALLLAILLATLRKATANVRYIIACVALGLIVLLPIATMSLVPVSTPEPFVDIEPPPAPVIVQWQPANVETPVAEIVEVEEPVRAESTNVAPRISWRQRAIAKLEASHPYLVMGWLIGVFGLSLWHLGGWAQLYRLKRHMVKPVDTSLQTTLSGLSKRLRVHRAVRLMESALVQVPTVVGWLRPMILLPASALTGLDVEQLEALLAHELAHIRRYDYLVNIGQTVVETLGFYHPAAWWISHTIRVERENCCDDLAISLSGNRIRYARALASMEEIRARRSELAVAATGGSLFGRIRRLVSKDTSDRSRTGWISPVITILLIAIIAIPASIALTAHIRQKDRKEEIDPQKVVLKLVDPNSQPVVGARVGTSVGWSDTAKNPLTWFLRDGASTRDVKVKTNKYGKVTLHEEDVFWSVPPTEQKAPLAAMDAGHFLAGLQELSREDLGKEVTLALQPGCRVHGRLTAAAARKRQLSPNILNVWVYWRVHTPYRYSSKQGRFDFILPPGEYKLRFFSSNSSNNFVIPILIKPGQRDLDVTGYLDGTSQLPETETNRRNRDGNIESNKVVLKLVGPNSQPVVGAWVGTYVDWSDIAESPPIYFLRNGGSYKASEIDSAGKVISDQEGKVTLTEEDLFKPYWPTEVTVPLTATDAGHYLAGLRELSREDLGKEVTVTLQPGCRVSGRVSAATARKRRWSTKTLTVYVHWRTHRPCQYTSKEGRFEFVLPPGKYEIQVYSTDSDKDVVFPIRIKPGQRDLDLTKYLDDTSEPSNAEKSDSSTKILIEAQIIHVTNEFLEQVGLDVNSLKRSDSWTQYRVDDSSNLSSFAIDSPTKEMLLKNVAESEGSSSISRLFMMGMSGREAMIKNNNGHDFKSQKLGRSIKIKPELSQDGQSTYVDCEFMMRQFKNLNLFLDVYINRKVDQNDVSESEVVEYRRNTGQALLSDDHTLLILGGKLVSFRDVENGTPILRDIPVIGQFFNTVSKIKVEKNEIVLIKTTIVSRERSDDIDSKASSYNVAKIGSKTSELLRIYLDLYLEAGQYVEIKDSGQRESKLKQVDTSSIGKSGKDFPAYASYIDFEIRSNVDLKLATQRFTRGSFFEHDKWDAYFVGPDTIIGNDHFSKTILCISMWRAKLWMDRADIASLVAVTIKPKNKQQDSSDEVEKVDPNSWQEKSAVPIEAEEGASTVAFEELSVKFSGMWIHWQDLQFTVRGDGSVAFSMNMGPRDKTKYKTAFKLSDEHLAELSGLLQKTNWLTAPGANVQPGYTDATRIDISLTREDKVQNIWCHDRNPEPYLALIIFLKRIERQEYLLNRMTAAGERERLDAFRDVNQELRAAEGDPVVAHPTPVLDYHRLVPVCKEVITHTDNNHREVIVTALKLLGLLRIESERDTMIKLTMAEQTSDEPSWSRNKTETVRAASVNALFAIGGEQSRQHIRKMARNHSLWDKSVNVAVVEALLKLDGDNAIDLLKNMVSTTERAAWALIRLGPAAARAIIEILERPVNPNDMSQVYTIREYINHWQEVSKPIDPRVIEAVLRNLDYRLGHSPDWTQYHKELLQLAGVPELPGKDARQIAEEFLAAVKADDQMAMDAITNTGGGGWPQRLAKLKELPGLQQLKVTEVYADKDDNIGMAVALDTSRQKGARVSIYLNFLSGSVWRVVNIAVERPEIGDRMTRRFLKSHPNAKPVPARQSSGSGHKTDAAIEAGKSSPNGNHAGSKSSTPRSIEGESQGKADKARIVKVDLSLVEVFPDSRVDRETTAEIRNVLGDKIAIPDSPAAADLLRKAAKATAAAKDESAGDKRITQQQFNTLFDLLVLMNGSTIMRYYFPTTAQRRRFRPRNCLVGACGRNPGLS